MAFEDIFKRYYNDLYNFVFHYIMDKEQSEDIVQDAFVSLMTNFDSVCQNTNFKQYLLFVAKNHCMSYFRRCSIMDRHNLRLTEALRFLNSEQYDSTYDELFAFLSESFEHLTPDQRRVIELKLEGKDYKNISEETGFPAHKVHKSVKQAYGKVKSLKNKINLIFTFF